MRTKQTTEITVYHTPDKTSKPDLKHQSHLKTTIPSVYEGSSSQRQYPSQYASHYSKMRNYDSYGGTPNLITQPQTQKRQSKNPWQIKQKLQQYESQISLLRQYLQSSQCVQKSSISRIFGFPQGEDVLARQQQRVIKQLGSKVKSLVRENASLKQQNAQYQQLNVQGIIEQNEKLQLLLQQYKRQRKREKFDSNIQNTNVISKMQQQPQHFGDRESLTINESDNNKIQYNRVSSLNRQLESLKDQLYREQLENGEKIKTLADQHEKEMEKVRRNQQELEGKVKRLEGIIDQFAKNDNSLVRNSNNNNNTLAPQQQKALSTNKSLSTILKQEQLQQKWQQLNMKIKQVELNNTKQLLDQETFYKQQLQEQQQYYNKQRLGLEEDLMKLEQRLVTELENNKVLENKFIEMKENYIKENDKLREYYKVEIDNMDKKNLERVNKINILLNMIEERIVHTDQSIEHMKFQRENRIQATIKKSHNIAISSKIPKGEPYEDQHNIVDFQEQQLKQNVNVGTSQLKNTINPLQSKLSSHQADILKQKIKYLEKEIEELKMKLSLNEKMNVQKTQKIIKLESQIQGLNNMILGLNYQLGESRRRENSLMQVKEIVKQVPTVPKEYSQEVKNIKETIISCNLANFDTFQSEFSEIIQQRNQLNDKMMQLKKQAKQSSKILVLEKHLKVQREKNKHLQENLKKYEREIEQLKIQVIELQGEIENIQQRQKQLGQSRKRGYQQSGIKSEEVRQFMFEHLPDGKAGLQWQKVVKHCLATSINRLQNLQNRMRQDITGQQQQQQKL